VEIWGAEIWGEGTWGVAASAMGRLDKSDG
jgi:hypothetical protein